jgi:hypothetical protein
MWSTLVRWVDDGFTLVDIQSLARDFMWSSLVSLWWILTLVDIGSLCKGFTWPSLVSLWWIFNLVDIQSLAIEAPNCIQSSYKVCTLCVLQDPVVGLLKWCKIYFKEFPYPTLWSKSCHKFGHLDLWVGWTSMGYNGGIL